MILGLLSIMLLLSTFLPRRETRKIPLAERVSDGNTVAAGTGDQLKDVAL